MPITATPKRRFNKVSTGPAANRPTITNSGVSQGDEYFADDTGEWSTVTLTAAGVKQWTVIALGAGIQQGTSQLAAGQVVVAATVGTTSRIFVSRRDLPGGGTAIGLLAVTAPLVGVAGANFTVTAVSEAAQVQVAADVSKFDWMIIG